MQDKHKSQVMDDQRKLAQQVKSVLNLFMRSFVHYGCLKHVFCTL